MNLYPICTFKSINDKEVSQVEPVSWDALVEFLSLHQEVERKEDVPLFSMVQYKEGSTRGKDNVKAVHGLVLDYDETLTLEEIRIRFKPFTYFLYTSFNHGIKGNRFRVVLPLAEPIPGVDWETFYPSVELLCPGRDTVTKHCAAIFYSPAHQAGKDFFFEENSGELLSLPALPVPQQKEAPKAAYVAPELFSEGGRNQGLYILGCSLRGKGLNDGAVRDALISANNNQCSTPLPHSELEVIIRQVCKFSVGEARKQSYIKAWEKWEEAPVDEVNYTREDLQEFVLDILAKQRRAMSATAIRREMERTIGKEIDKGMFSSRVQGPLIEQGKLFKTDPNNPRSPLTLEKPVTIHIRGMTDGLDESEYELLYPILPVLNDELKTDCHQPNGGLGRGDVFMFNAGTGYGKSYFYLTCAKNAADMGLRVLYLDMENKEIRLKHRFGRLVAGRNLSNSELKPVLEPYSSLWGWGNLGQEGTVSDTYFRNLIRGWDVVVIDYLKLEKFSASKLSESVKGSPGSYIMQLLCNAVRDENCILITGTQVVETVKGAGGKIQKINYRGGPGWVEVAGDCWTALEKFDEDSDGYSLKIQAIKSRDRLLPPGRVFELQVNTKTANYKLVA